MGWLKSARKAVQKIAKVSYNAVAEPIKAAVKNPAKILVAPVNIARNAITLIPDLLKSDKKSNTGSGGGGGEAATPAVPSFEFPSFDFPGFPQIPAMPDMPDMPNSPTFGNASENAKLLLRGNKFDRSKTILTGGSGSTGTSAKKKLFGVNRQVSSAELYNSTLGLKPLTPALGGAV